MAAEPIPMPEESNEEKTAPNPVVGQPEIKKNEGPTPDGQNTIKVGN